MDVEKSEKDQIDPDSVHNFLKDVYRPIYCLNEQKKDGKSIEGADYLDHIYPNDLDQFIDEFVGLQKSEEHSEKLQEENDSSSDYIFSIGSKSRFFANNIREEMEKEAGRFTSYNFFIHRLKCLLYSFFDAWTNRAYLLGIILLLVTLNTYTSIGVFAFFVFYSATVFCCSHYCFYDLGVVLCENLCCCCVFDRILGLCGITNPDRSGRGWIWRYRYRSYYESAFEYALEMEYVYETCLFKTTKMCIAIFVLLVCLFLHFLNWESTTDVKCYVGTSNGTVTDPSYEIELKSYSFPMFLGEIYSNENLWDSTERTRFADCELLGWDFLNYYKGTIVGIIGILGFIIFGIWSYNGPGTQQYARQLQKLRVCNARFPKLHIGWADVSSPNTSSLIANVINLLQILRIHLYMNPWKNPIESIEDLTAYEHLDFSVLEGISAAELGFLHYFFIGALDDKDIEKEQKVPLKTKLINMFLLKGITVLGWIRIKFFDPCGALVLDLKNVRGDPYNTNDGEIAFVFGSTKEMKKMIAEAEDDEENIPKFTLNYLAKALWHGRKKCVYCMFTCCYCCVLPDRLLDACLSIDGEYECEMSSKSTRKRDEVEEGEKDEEDEGEKDEESKVNTKYEEKKKDEYLEMLTGNMNKGPLRSLFQEEIERRSDLNFDFRVQKQEEEEETREIYLCFARCCTGMLCFDYIYAFLKRLMIVITRHADDTRTQKTNRIRAEHFLDLDMLQHDGVEKKDWKEHLPGEGSLLTYLFSGQGGGSYKRYEWARPKTNTKAFFYKILSDVLHDESVYNFLYTQAAKVFFKCMCLLWLFLFIVIAVAEFVVISSSFFVFNPDLSIYVPDETKEGDSSFFVGPQDSDYSTWMDESERSQFWIMEFAIARFGVYAFLVVFLFLLSVYMMTVLLVFSDDIEEQWNEFSYQRLLRKAKKQKRFYETCCGIEFCVWNVCCCSCLYKLGNYTDNLRNYFIKKKQITDLAKDMQKVSEAPIEAPEIDEKNDEKSEPLTKKESFIKLRKTASQKAVKKVEETLKPRDKYTDIDSYDSFMQAFRVFLMRLDFFICDAFVWMVVISIFAIAFVSLLIVGLPFFLVSYSSIVFFFLVPPMLVLVSCCGCGGMFCLGLFLQSLLICCVGECCSICCLTYRYCCFACCGWLFFRIDKDEKLEREKKKEDSNNSETDSGDDIKEKSKGDDDEKKKKEKDSDTTNEFNDVFDTDSDDDNIKEKPKGNDEEKKKDDDYSNLGLKDELDICIRGCPYYMINAGDYEMDLMCLIAPCCGFLLTILLLGIYIGMGILTISLSCITMLFLLILMRFLFKCCFKPVILGTRDCVESVEPKLRGVVGRLVQKYKERKKGKKILQHVKELTLKHDIDFRLVSDGDSEASNSTGEQDEQETTSSDTQISSEEEKGESDDEEEKGENDEEEEGGGVVTENPVEGEEDSSISYEENTDLNRATDMFVVMLNQMEKQALERGEEEYVLSGDYLKIYNEIAGDSGALMTKEERRNMEIHLAFIEKNRKEIGENIFDRLSLLIAMGRYTYEKQYHKNYLVDDYLETIRKVRGKLVVEELEKNGVKPSKENITKFFEGVREKCEKGTRKIFDELLKSVSKEKLDRKSLLLRWVQRVTEPYNNVDVKDFTLSWKDGLAFNAILHQFDNELVDYSSLTKDDPAVNCKIALEATDRLGNFRTSEDFIDSDISISDSSSKLDVPDEQSVIKYVNLIYQHCLSQGDGESKGEKELQLNIPKEGEEEDDKDLKKEQLPEENAELEESEEENKNVAVDGTDMYLKKEQVLEELAELEESEDAEIFVVDGFVPPVEAVPVGLGTEEVIAIVPDVTEGEQGVQHVQEAVREEKEKKEEDAEDEPLLFDKTGFDPEKEKEHEMKIASMNMWEECKEEYKDFKGLLETKSGGFEAANTDILFDKDYYLTELKYILNSQYEKWITESVLEEAKKIVDKYGSFEFSANGYKSLTRPLPEFRERKRTLESLIEKNEKLLEMTYKKEWEKGEKVCRMVLKLKFMDRKDDPYLPLTRYEELMRLRIWFLHYPLGLVHWITMSVFSKFKDGWKGFKKWWSDLIKNSKLAKKKKARTAVNDLDGKSADEEDLKEGVEQSSGKSEGESESEEQSSAESGEEKEEEEVTSDSDDDESEEEESLDDEASDD